ncbi:MAG TPA: tetratricopeptide repeat protein, partial [Xanthomonadales bacterium]|nr:tetratricopeptide repeat protein [Xanthomonadales bacterium]
DLAFAEHNLGLVYSALGNPAEALRHFDAALAAYAATIGTDTAHGPIRLHIDRAHARLAARDSAGARSDALRARELAQRHNILWIVDEADAVLARMPARRTPVAIEPPPRVEPPPPVTLDPIPPQPQVELPKPPPRKDVGVYGSSQGW